MSSDEDILVKKEDYEKLKDILCGEGLEFIEKEGNECAYLCRNTGLCIEVSTSLFSHESKAYGHLNRLFDDIFEKYTSRHELVRVKTTNMGTLYELTYTINLKTPEVSKQFIDDIRCRNGNLNIICGRESDKDAI